MIGSTLSHFRVTAKLGAGGMGEVYRAEDSALGREVAIKVLPAALGADPERLVRFEREAKLLAQLHHPHIASIFGLEESGGVRALVMELVEGPTLAERLATGPLAVEEALRVAHQVAEALEAAHEKGIVHRDLKPQNVKAPPDGAVKVLDFGLAKALDPAVATGAQSDSQLAASPTLTQGATAQGVILGTAAYMAPEQAKGAAVDKRADIWAFGVILHEMLTGKRPFEGDSAAETLAQVLKAEIDLQALPPETPAAVRGLLRRCLERNPKNRLHDVADARLVLDEVHAGRDDEAAGSVAAARRGVSRRKIAAWATALLASVVALALLVGRGGRSQVAAGRPPPVTRFAVVPEEKGILAGYPALAPDGRTLVYALRAEEGPPVLWAHSFATGVGRRIPGTEGAEQPFWSPDGKHLAFFAGGELKRLDLATGLAQALAPVADARGGTWGADGSIYFAPDVASAILQVPAASGTPRAATEFDPHRGAQGHRFPWALPGGAVVYTCIGDPEVRGIYWRGGGSASARRILEDVSRPVYDERGYLLWVRDGALVAQRFDVTTGTLSGELTSLAESVGVDSQVKAENLYAASSAGTIALRTGSGASELRWLDRSGAPLDAVISRERFAEPALSPDGRRVAVWKQGESDEIWVYEAADLDHGRRLSFGASGAELPIWSPDGRWIAWSSPRSSGWQILRKAADGSGGEEILFESGVSSWLDAWWPDGGSLLFERFMPGRGADLWILPLDGSRRAVPFLETPANETHAAISRDGRLIAYVSDESGRGEVYVRTVAQSGGQWQISQSGGDWPAWSRDGKELFFAGLDRTLFAVPIASLDRFAFGEPAPLFRLRTFDPKITSFRTAFAVSPDGERFVVSQLLDAPGDERIDIVMHWAPAAVEP